MASAALKAIEAKLDEIANLLHARWVTPSTRARSDASCVHVDCVLAFAFALTLAFVLALISAYGFSDPICA